MKVRSIFFVVLIIVVSINIAFADTSLTAGEIANQLKANGLPVGNIIVYNEWTDDNGLLGTPGSYTSKANFGDNRLTGEGSSESDEGRIEVFSNAEDCKDRYDYLADVYDQNSYPIHMYILDNVLFRFTDELSVDDYLSTLKSIIGQPTVFVEYMLEASMGDVEKAELNEFDNVEKVEIKFGDFSLDIPTTWADDGDGTYIIEDYYNNQGYATLFFNTTGSGFNEYDIDEKMAEQVSRDQYEGLQNFQASQISINGIKFVYSEYNFKLEIVPIKTETFYFINPSNGALNFIQYMESVNSDYSHFSDFHKVMNSIKLVTGPTILHDIKIRSSGDVNVREKPDADSRKVGTARASGIYECTEVSSNGWYRIILENGVSGYVSPKLASQVDY